MTSIKIMVVLLSIAVIGQAFALAWMADRIEDHRRELQYIRLEMGRHDRCLNYLYSVAPKGAQP